MKKTCYALKAIIVILAIYATPAIARFGETLEQCTERYGVAKRVNHPDGIYFEFQKSGITIRAAFAESGSCDWIYYRRVDEFREREIIHLLVCNASQWDPISGKAPGQVERYTSKESGLEAVTGVFSKGSGRRGHLIITTKEAIARARSGLHDWSDLEGF